MDCTMLPHAKTPISHYTPSEITRQQRCERYLKHVATQTCRLSAHRPTCPVRPKLHLVDLLSSITRKFATNTQEIKTMELEP